VTTITFGSSLSMDATPREQVERLARIARDVTVFCLKVKATSVGVESYAFAQGRQAHAHALAELGGAVKVNLFTAFNLVAEPVVASRARKVLLQHLPRKDVKAYVQANVRRLGGQALEWTHDQVDSFVIANYMVMVAGGVAMTFDGI
jgi:hypothetical protein